MNVAPISSPANYVAQVRSQPAPAATPRPTASVGGDSDGDNDGSKGGSVDVRA